MWNSSTEDEKFINANNKVALAHYHWTLDMEIIGHTEVNINY